MQRLPERFIEEVREANPIQDVVGEYVQFQKQSGNNLFACCPFHAEKTPSFSVAKHKNLFHCFGCQKGGDVISFIAQIEHLSYREAILFLAKRAGLTPPVLEQSDSDEKQEKQKKWMKQCNALAANYFFKNLYGPLGEKARNYLKSRKIVPELAKQFALGYALDDWQGLTQYLQKELGESFHVDQLVTLGLLKKNEKGRVYDVFRDRLIFPIVNTYGEVIAFGARRLSDLAEHQNEGMNPKYLNSPETPVYHKGSHLYGLNLAKKSKANQLLLLEGYLDVMAAHRAGIDYAVGVLGTALTETQAKLLKRYTNELILCFDADEAGQKATLRALVLLKKYDLNLRVLVLPDQKDVDAYITAHGSALFRSLIQQAKEPLDYLYDYYKKEHTHQGILASYDFAKSMLACLIDMDVSAIRRDAYLQKVAFEAQLSFSALLEDYRKLKEQPQKNRLSSALSSHVAMNRGQETPTFEEPHLPKILEAAPFYREELQVLHLIIHYDYIYNTNLPYRIELEDFLSEGMKHFVKAMFKQERQSMEVYLEWASEYQFRNGTLKSGLTAFEMEVGQQKVSEDAYLIALVRLKLKSLNQRIQHYAQDRSLDHLEDSTFLKWIQKRKMLQEFLAEKTQEKQ